MCLQVYIGHKHIIRVTQKAVPSIRRKEGQKAEEMTAGEVMSYGTRARLSCMS